MQTLETTPKVKSRSAGFTLVELCIVIILLGTVIAVVATGYQSWQKKVLVETNQERIATISEKIYDYKKIHGQYPEPASLTIPRGDANYGYSQNDAGVGAVTAGSGISGFYAQDGVSGRKVQIGALPFRELNIPEDESYDVYGSRIIYAITAEATQPNFKENRGALKISNEAGQELFEDSFPGVFAIFSAGKNRKGGFSRSGEQVQACNGTTADTANCDFLTGATTADFRSNAYSEASDTSGSTNDYFDDIIAFNRLPAQESQWRRGLIGEGEDANDLIDMSESNIYVGAQKKVEASDGKLSILYSGESPNFDGSLYIRGALRTKEICTDNGTNCFNVAGLEKTCDAGEYVIGFYNGQPQCGPIFFGCPPGEIVVGVKADGTPNCAIAPLAPENGACGSAHGQQLGSAPTEDSALCSGGDPMAVTGIGPWSWSCRGTNGGTDASCSAQKQEPPINGACGSDHGQTLDNTPTNRCSSGTSVGFTGSGPWSWTCQGEGPGHTDASCSAQKRIVTPPVCECGPGNCPTTPTSCSIDVSTYSVDRGCDGSVLGEDNHYLSTEDGSTVQYNDFVNAVKFDAKVYCDSVGASCCELSVAATTTRLNQTLLFRVKATNGAATLTKPRTGTLSVPTTGSNRHQAYYTGVCPGTTLGACGPQHESNGWIGPPSPNPPGGAGPDGQYCSGGVTGYVSMFSPSPGVETYTWTCGTGSSQVNCRSLPQTN